MSRDELEIEGLTDADRQFAGSRFAEVREAIFANPYQRVWGAAGEPPFERSPVTFGTVMHGLFRFGKPWVLLAAARRTLASQADLRWGPDGKGYRRLLHANAICMTGMWEITEETPYSGYFRKGSRGLVVARYSTCCTETRRGNTRSLSMVGRVYPTTNPEHAERLPPPSFITQQDIGGDSSESINEAVLRNAPNTTVFRRGLGFTTLLASGAAFNRAETQPTIRQVYQIAELDLPAGQPTRAPEFMQLSVVPEQPVIPGAALDFRDELMAQLYDRGDPQPKRTLTFRIETSDEGKTLGNPFKERREFQNWRTIGTMTFNAAVASWNSDHVLHFHHPPWRQDRNDVSTVHRGK
jgi:hypothetical protein